MSKSSEIVTSGCSFTEFDYNLFNDTEFKKYGFDIENLPFDIPRYDCWPVLLEKKLNVKVTNFGRKNSGNYGMCKRVQDYVVKNHSKIKFCIIALSEWHRAEYSTTLKRLTKEQESNLFPKSSFYLQCVDSTLRSMYELQSVCNKYNIPCVFFQLLKPFPAGPAVKYLFHSKMMKLHKKIMKRTLENPYFDLINKKYCIGWPFLKDLGGHSLWETHFVKRNDTTIGNILVIKFHDDDLTKPYLGKLNDWHPNQKGHQMICDYIEKELERLKLI